MTPNASQTTITFAQQQQLLASRAYCDARNASNQAIFDGAVRDYDANMESGQTHATPPVKPVAPGRWVLMPQDALGFVYPAQSSSVFLTPTPPLKIDSVDLGSLQPATPAVGNIDIGVHLTGAWYAIGPTDTFPVGMTTPPQADGHTYERFGSEMGTNKATGINSGWYLRLD